MKSRLLSSLLSRRLALFAGCLVFALAMMAGPSALAQTDDGGNDSPYGNETTKEAQKEADDFSWMLPAFVLGGVVLGLFLVFYVLPRFSEKIGSMLYDSGEMAEPDPHSVARAKLAQGDYKGAIEEFEKIREEQPTERMPVVEICRIYEDKLMDAQSGLEYMEKALQSQEWAEDDAAFFMFRIADLRIELKEDTEGAKAILEQIAEQFPGTRHSANANHKKSKLGLT